VISGYLRLSPLVLALLLFSLSPARAIIIEQSAPIVIKDEGAGPSHRDPISFNIPFSDPGRDPGAWTIGLTSGQLAIDKSVIIGGAGAAHLGLKRYEPAPSNIFPVRSAPSVSIEAVTIDQRSARSTRLVLLTAGTTAMLFLSVALFCRHQSQRNGRRIRFGLLWDGHRQPICTKCDRPLRVLNDFSFQCPSCQVELGARAENGLTISPREALARIQLKEYWVGR
jgi:hypothetical protein